MVVFPKGEAGAGTSDALFKRYLKMSTLTGANAKVEIAAGYPVDPKVDEILSVVQRPAVRVATVAAGPNASTAIVNGITTSDRIISVLAVLTAAGSANTSVDFTHEFSISATNQITNSGGTNLSSYGLVVTWEQAPVDYTSITRISSKGNFKIDTSPVILTTGGVTTVATAVFDTTGDALGENMLEKTDGFLLYAWRPGDLFVATAGTNITAAAQAGVEVLRWASKDAIQLAGNITSPDADQSDIGGYILRGTKGAKLEVVHTLRGVR